MGIWQRWWRRFRPARLYMLHADCLRAFHLPGRLPVDEARRARLRAREGKSPDLDFFGWEFFADYERVLEFFLQRAQDDAMEDFRRFARKLPLLQQALAAEIRGGIDAADQFWQQIYRLDPLDAVAAYHEGCRLFLAADWDAAIRHFALAVGEYPEYHAARRQWARALLEAGRSEEARDVLHCLLERCPSDRDALAILERLGDVIAVYEDPRQPEQPTFLKREAWKRCVEEEMVRNWLQDDLLQDLGRRLLDHGFPQLARRCLERACSLKEDPACLFTLGLACSELGEYQDALRLFQELLEIRPDNAALHEAVAVAQLGLDRPDLARRHLRIALEEAPARRNAVDLYARVLTLRDGESAARHWLNQLALEQPENPWPLVSLAARLRDDGELEAALACLEAARRRAPEEESLCAEAAVLCGRLGRHDEVVRLLKDRLQNEEWTPLRLWNLALAYRDLSRPREAEEAFRGFLRTDVPARFQGLARRELDRLGAC